MPVSPSNNLLMIGHSLVGQDIPKMVESQNSDLGHTGDVDYQVIIGAPLRISWNDHDQPHAQGVDSRAALATGEYGAVVMTEAVPLETNVEWNDTSGFALNFHNLAYENNPDVQTYFYETWHGFDFFDGDLAAWRASLDDYLPMWEGVVDEVNANRAPGSKEMLLVPGGQAMAQIYDAIEAGELPGYTSIRDLFEDDIHPTKEGEQLIAALTTSVVYGHDPADLSDTTMGEFGPFPAPSPAMAEMINTIVYRTVDEYDRDGIDASEFRAPGDPVDPVDPPAEPEEPVVPVDPPVEPEEPPVDPEPPVEPEEPQEPVQPGTVVNGWKASYWALEPGTAFADMDFSTTPDETGVINQVDYVQTDPIWEGGPQNHFAAKFEANLEISASGEYQMLFGSAQPAVFYVNGEMVLDRSGATGFDMFEVSLDFSEGPQSIEVRYLEGDAATDVYVGYRGADTGGENATVSGPAVSHFAGETAPEEPVDPPVEPEEPVTPPVDPVDPEEPPVEPEEPVTPPEEPEEPVTPPVEPEQPEEPPVEPEQPEEPVTPPIDPEEPEEPVTPPVDPEEPPVDPEEPSVPEEPEEPAPVDPTPTNPEDPDDEGEEPQNGDTAAGGACFVATAAYGDRMAEPVVALRHFRDHHLVNSLAGRAFVRAYWVVGPKLAERVRPESAAGRTSRFVLDRMVTVLRRAGLTGGQ